jgi:hypothetical protein
MEEDDDFECGLEWDMHDFQLNKQLEINKWLDSTNIEATTLQIQPTQPNTSWVDSNTSFDETASTVSKGGSILSKLSFGCKSLKSKGSSSFQSPTPSSSASLIDFEEKYDDIEFPDDFDSRPLALVNDETDGFDIEEDFDLDQARVDGVLNQSLSSRMNQAEMPIESFDDEFPDIEDEISSPIISKIVVPSTPLMKKESKIPVKSKLPVKKKPPMNSKEAKKMAALDAKKAAKLLAPPAPTTRLTAKSLFFKMMPKRIRKESTTSQSSVPAAGKKTPVPSKPSTGTIGRNSIPNYMRPTTQSAAKVVEKVVTTKNTRYSDGSELDSIGSLKVNKAHEAKYTKFPKPAQPFALRKRESTPPTPKGISQGALSRNNMGNRQVEAERPFHLSLRSTSTRPPPASPSRNSKQKPRKQPALIQSRGAPTREKLVGKMVFLFF